MVYSMTFSTVFPTATTYKPLARVTVVDSAAVVVYTNWPETEYMRTCMPQAPLMWSVPSAAYMTVSASSSDVMPDVLLSVVTSTVSVSSA